MMNRPNHRSQNFAARRANLHQRVEGTAADVGGSGGGGGIGAASTRANGGDEQAPTEPRNGTPRTPKGIYELPARATRN